MIIKSQENLQHYGLEKGLWHFSARKFADVLE